MAKFQWDGSRVLALLDEKDMKQTELVDMMNQFIADYQIENVRPVRQQYLDRWLKNKHVPTITIVGIIAQLLDTTTDYLTGFSDNPVNEQVYTKKDHQLIAAVHKLKDSDAKDVFRLLFDD